MKDFKKWITYYTLFLLLIAVFVFVTNWCVDTKDFILQYSILVVTGLGFIFAIQQLKLSVNQYLDGKKKEFENFLDLSIGVTQDEPFYSIRTQVYNKSTENKAIDYSFILISQQGQNIITTVNNILNSIGSPKEITCSNDFNKIREMIPTPIFIEGTVGIIPLDFYYSENVQIGNESPSFTFTFNKNDYQLKEGIYTARFFIYPELGYHRSTADNFVIV